MSHIDHAVTAYVFPQDGGTGTTDSNADWTNAAFIGGLAKAAGRNYVDTGMTLSADYVNGTYSITSGLAFIHDTRSVGYRVPSDNEETRSGDWTQGYLAFFMMPADTTGLALNDTSGMNYIWIYFTNTGQNNCYIRVGNSESDAPSIPNVLIGTIDAGNQIITELNRVAGLGWTFCGFDNFTTLQSSVTTSPDVVYDEMILRMYGVAGDATSAYILDMTINGITSGGYKFRTTQGNASGSAIYMAHTVPASCNISGEIAMTGKFPDGIWSFSNRQAGATSKYVSFYGNHDATGDTTIQQATFQWGSGNIKGYFEWWGRNYVGINP